MNFILYILCIILGFCLSFFLEFEQIKANQELWNFSICDIISILIEIIIGIFFATYISKKQSKEAKKVDFLIDQIETLKDYLKDNIDPVHNKLRDLSNIDNKKAILVFFKTINAKIFNIKSIEIKQQINFENIENICQKHHKKICGDEFDQNRNYDNSSIDEFKKDMESINQTLDTLLAKILNGK